jgi:hypothetical protein
MIASNPSCMCIKDVIFGCCIAAHKIPSNLWSMKTCIGRSLACSNTRGQFMEHQAPIINARITQHTSVFTIYQRHAKSSLTPHLTEHNRLSEYGHSNVDGVA